MLMVALWKIRSEQRWNGHQATRQQRCLQTERQA